MRRILVVDDERQITRMLRTSLQTSGYQVDVASNGREALTQFQTNPPDLVITDLAMPEMDGLELTRALRLRTHTPILVLSVRDTDAMKVAALDEGADDYLTKPFSMQELLARVRAQLRRPFQSNVKASVLEAGLFRLNLAAHTATLNGEALSLTPKEFQLLELLLEKAGAVVTHKVLMRAIWGPRLDDQHENLRVLVAQLRKKLERGDGQRFIQSEPWIGYRLLVDDGSQDSIS